ncbi:protein fem-1 homolog B-like [Mya arenaria]|uniref:protein fem-1 homolog B-like n=1 Tax=Mya arenaria TaxID=6604 RepID=UPI0022E585EB|nr:protein fem-1 homolog B-like [Mya arenaria]
MSSKLSLFEIELLKTKVFQAARDGRAISIFSMLWNLDRETVVNEVLNHHTSEQGQWTTPLIIAARNGQDKVVLILLSNFNANVEQTGTVKFDGFSIEGATPLWCAAGAGHHNIVKMLIEHGANVNHTTATNSTPLRAACFDGRLDIVKYLIENKADVSIANRYKNTCLMISCYKGHKDVVQFLLDSGAPMDERALCGATALHFSAECGHVDIVKLLVEHAAQIVNNNSGLSPLMVAAECIEVAVVEYLTSAQDCCLQSKIDAYELLGASFANDKEQYDLEKAYLFLHKGMVERYKDPKRVLLKSVLPPVSAYENHVECQTLEELERIQLIPGALHMEGLAVRERILGSDNQEVAHPVIYRGAVFADSGSFDRCIALWLHAMQLRQNVKRSISKDLLRFAQVFSQMVHLGNLPVFESVLEVFERGTVELKNDRERLKNSPDDNENLQEIYEENFHTLLYLLIIATKLKPSVHQITEVCRAVYKLLQQHPKLRNGYTPLHMATASGTIVDDFHVNDVVSFPNGNLCKLLLDCGAEVNARDKLGNTSLHLIVQYIHPINDFENLHTCMMALLKAGAHLDIRNNDGKTASDVATTIVAEAIIRKNNVISLKCIAARSVKQAGVPYKGFIPRALEDFVLMH